MTNEWLEFKAYTDTPVFLAESKQSTAFIGRFTVRMIKQNKGFNRILTILKTKQLPMKWRKMAVLRPKSNSLSEAKAIAL